MKAITIKEYRSPETIIAGIINYCVILQKQNIFRISFR